MTRYITESMISDDVRQRELAPDTINSVLKKFFTAYNVQGGKIITVLKMYREAAVLQKGVNGNLRRESA